MVICEGSRRKLKNHAIGGHTSLNGSKSDYFKLFTNVILLSIK